MAIFFYVIVCRICDSFRPIFHPLARPCFSQGADRHAVFMVLKHAKVQFESNRELQVVSAHTHPLVHSCICECAILQKALRLLRGKRRGLEGNGKGTGRHTEEEGLEGPPLASRVLNSNFWPSLASNPIHKYNRNHTDRGPCGANVCVCPSLCLCCVPCRGD